MIAAGEQACAGGCAHGRDIEPRELDALPRKRVEIRRLQVGIPVAGEIAVALVIAHDEQDIGTARSGKRAGGRHGGESAEQLPPCGLHGYAFGL
jgi:hypothetical protein